MRLGIVLGAGGYPGWPFQLAALAAVEDELGVDVRDAELLVGTSVGSMTALLLRGGFSVRDMIAHAEGRPQSAQATALLQGMDPPGDLPPRMPPWRPPSPFATALPAAWWLLSGQGRRRNWVPGAAASLLPRGRVDHGVFGRAADSLLEAWPDRDTWVVAMRARDGARRVFGRDAHTTPGRAVTASSSIPGYFRPVDVDGEAHVDAGVLSTTNADLLTAREDLDLVVVVPPLAAAEPRALTVDLPLRWLVNAQIEVEVEQLRAAGHAVAVAAPPATVVRSMQGDPIRMSSRRVQGVLDATRQWASEWARTTLRDHAPSPLASVRV